MFQTALVESSESGAFLCELGHCDFSVVTTQDAFTKLKLPVRFDQSHLTATTRRYESLLLLCVFSSTSVFLEYAVVLVAATLTEMP